MKVELQFGKNAVFLRFLGIYKKRIRIKDGNVYNGITLLGVVIVATSTLFIRR